MTSENKVSKQPTNEEFQLKDLFGHIFVAWGQLIELIFEKFKQQKPNHSHK